MLTSLRSFFLHQNLIIFVRNDVAKAPQTGAYSDGTEPARAALNAANIRPMQVACNKHGRINVTILRTTAQNISNKLRMLIFPNLGDGVPQCW